MDANIQRICEMVIQNRAVFYKEMTWEFATNNNAIMAALITAAQNREITSEQYKECKKILKKHAGVFSEFRGIANTIVITKMTMQSDPEAYLLGSMEVYKKLRNAHKFTASPYMVMAALTLYENGGVEKADYNIEQLDKIYYAMRADHPFLISDADRGYLAMLVAANLNSEKMVSDVEDCYQTCKKMTINKDAVHSLAQVLALSPKSTEAKTENVKKVVADLSRRGKYISKSYGLPAIGALELIDLSTDEKVRQILEVDEYLKDKKGFRWYNDGSKIRRMYASLIVLMANSSGENALVASNVSSTMTMTIVETIIMMLIIMMVNASHSSTSSSH